MKDSENQQSIKTKLGEIRFRRVLSEQELGGETHIPEAFSKEEIMTVILNSMEETRSVFSGLVDSSLPISPFVELGAERGHRSFVLCNEFEAHGFALDLSMDALQFGDRIMKDLSLDKAPVRVCGDAYNLPFHSNSFPFVFCFATLHHFPDPTPVVQEATRILRDGGYFYFGREPTQGRLAIRLWTRYGYKLSWVEQLLDRLGILGFVSEGGEMEREYGILENTFPLSTWVDLTEPFDHVDMQVNQALKIRFDPSRFSFQRWLGQKVGGVTNALCHLTKSEPSLKADSWIQRLRCPTCSTQEEESDLELLPSNEGLQCVRCRTIYPQYNGVLLLISRDMREKLYPDWSPVVNYSVSSNDLDREKDSKDAVRSV